METIQQILQDSVNGGFWKFTGYVIIIGIPINGIVKLVELAMKYWAIGKHGWRPSNKREK